MLTHDLIHASRSVRKSPVFLALGLVCLGLALGVCTTTFAILDAALHPYVPFDNPDRLFSMQQWGRGASERVTWFDKYTALRDHAQSYDGIGLYTMRLGMVEGPAGIEQRRIASVSANLFPLLGLTLVAGRSFDTSTDDDRTAIISYTLWQRLFVRRALEHATISIDDHVYAVIGVAPPEMRFPWEADVWLRLPARAAITGAGIPWITPVVRLRSSATLEAARAELELVAARLTDFYGTGLQSFSYELQSVRPDPLELREIHAAMAGGALAILLIACANLANLLLARGIVTRRDLAVRRALGATRGALIRQLLIEGCLIALAGGMLGLFLSAWGVDLLRQRLPTEVEFIGVLAPRFSWRVYLFGLTATATTVLLSPWRQRSDRRASP